ncbi:MAG: DNA-binding response regulator [Chloroflexi bacterium]|nr:MAG: DNA-binding response regulator [Chloroflexota bacterium]MBL1195430.1 DNA-binding response regulator [Chloroflexota bacterium]NOH12713.1 response regulator transcription factor [Chloroflexota bacterium]
MKPARVLLADDHILFREGLAGIIAEQPDMEVVGEANDGLEAIVKSQELEPDLILMDVQMPTCDGIEATLRIKNEMPGVTIVMLTVRDDDEKLFQALKYGAQGYLLKNIRSREMLQMLRGALEGEAAISPELAGRLLEEFRRLSKQTFADIEVDLETLTDREQEVLQLVVSKYADKDIAEKLRISLHTVKSHIRNILAKLQVNNRREAARLARQKGWW